MTTTISGPEIMDKTLDNACMYVDMLKQAVAEYPEAFGFKNGLLTAQDAHEARIRFMHTGVTTHGCHSEEGLLLGAICHRRIDCDTLQLAFLFRLKSARQCGVGRQLLKAALLASREYDDESVLIDVMSLNHGAKRLYESLGFLAYSTGANNPDTAVQMELYGAVAIDEAIETLTNQL